MPAEGAIGCRLRAPADAGRDVHAGGTGHSGGPFAFYQSPRPRPGQAGDGSDRGDQSQGNGNGQGVSGEGGSKSEELPDDLWAITYECAAICGFDPGPMTFEE